jgi:argininosuccinate lyase
MSTSMPISRERVAELLGFWKVIESTFDAIASGDVYSEALAVLAGLATEGLRVLGDLAFWARDDVGVMVPGDEFIHADMSQPQRRDPQVLANLRIRLLDHVAGLSPLLGVLSGRRMLGSEAEHHDAIERTVAELTAATGTLGLLARVLRSMVVNRAVAAQRAQRGFATSSELADLLMIDFKLPPLDARRLAEGVIVEALRVGLDITTLKPELVDQVAMREIGREIGIEPEMLSRCLAPKRFLERRDALGGPAPSAVGATLERESFAARHDAAWVRDRRSEIVAARAALWEGREGMLQGRAVAMADASDDTQDGG